VLALWVLVVLKYLTKFALNLPENSDFTQSGQNLIRRTYAGLFTISTIPFDLRDLGSGLLKLKRLLALNTSLT
jgi:hypothetical protein